MDLTFEKEESALGASLLLPLEQKKKKDEGTKKKRVLVVGGPTACGKTELSLIIAKEWGGEIISADSMQVYRGMDIGTAKVSMELREQVPHHLIDICDLSERFNVVDFFYAARQVCEGILSRGKIPIIVGGAGFYLRAFLYGPPPGPPSVPIVRKSLEDELETLGPEVLFQRLQLLDPVYSLSITKNDRQKIIRALEIMTLTGDKVSQLDWRKQAATSSYDFRCWFIYRPREILYERVEERCQEMLDADFVDEVRALENDWQLHNHPQASQAIGYQQCLRYFATQQTPDDYATFVEEFLAASRQYVKRQFTWFRKEPVFRWINVDLHDLETAAEIMMQDYNWSL
ncbi:tRNA (adenosine(37)-N6)-dimethylallyltransferase MiaA [Simkania negevensis]|uniref:tRNA dimethylallyltransferase n=1 Tax=Simkania negevensis TaxID=83561 RepID=A0ABS3AVB3_9BACT|nr:tRNA (adenosine(37)-N6)-dimethylallyltransferase MiaA [Simkania negevensis]